MAMNRLRSAQFTFWRYAEGRAIFEWQSFYVLRGLLKRLPKGDGHTVVVFPGFGGSDRSTAPMRGLLKDLGYRASGWGLGSNVMYDESLEAEMLALVQEAYRHSGTKVSLIGWSLGGIFAREIAKACPEMVRCVITLGSPISGRNRHSKAHKLFDAINGHDGAGRRYRRFDLPPAVPTTSIYSKTDGIVAWEGSIQREASEASVAKALAQTENIQIPASHLGIGVNPLAMYAVADRLAQPLDQWRPFSRAGLKGLLFRQAPKRRSA